jgi:hypothetical protein
MSNRKEVGWSKRAKPQYDPHDRGTNPPDAQEPWHTSDSFTANDPPLPIQHSTNSVARMQVQDDPMMNEANAFLPTCTRDPEDEGYKQ